MIEQTLHKRGTTLVRRLQLAPGEATRWHRDPFHRVSVVLSGKRLTIEFRDGRSSHEVPLTSGQVDWDEPGEKIHRAVNTGSEVYEEVTFFLNDPEAVPQPDEGTGTAGEP